MPNYLKVSTTGAFTSVDGSKTLQTVHTEYIAVNKGTASSPDWQAVGMLGESITHHGTSPAHGQHAVSTRSAHGRHTTVWCGCRGPWQTRCRDRTNALRKGTRTEVHASHGLPWRSQSGREARNNTHITVVCTHLFSGWGLVGWVGRCVGGRGHLQERSATPGRRE